MLKRKSFAITAAAIVLLLTASYVWADYNKTEVVQVMRTTSAKLGEIRSAVSKGDYFAAASAFFEIAKGMQSIRKYTPYRGTQASWDSTLDAIVSAALKGVGAAGEKNAAAVNKYLAELQELNKTGHAAHK